MKIVTDQRPLLSKNEDMQERVPKRRRNLRFTFRQFPLQAGDFAPAKQ